MIYTYSVNGTPLNDPAGRWFLERATGRRSLPAVRSTATTLPALHGETFPVRDRLEASTLGLTVAVTDNDANGAPRGSTQAELNLEHITGVFNAPQLEVDHKMNMVSRVNIGRRLTSVEPKSEAAGLTMFKVPFIVRFPNPFWADTTGAGQTIEAPLSTATSTVSLTNLTGGNAPVLDPILRFKGPLNHISVTCPISGTGVSWSGSLADDRFLFIAPGEVRAWTNGQPGAWSLGSSSASGALDYPPEGPLEIWPALESSTPYRLSIQRNAALTDADAFAIRSRRSFL